MLFVYCQETHPAALKCSANTRQAAVFFKNKPIPISINEYQSILGR